VVATYAAALDSAGLTLATVFDDAPFSYANGRPVSNWYSTGYRGRTSIRKAIEQSMNVVTVKVLTQITPQLGFDYLLNFGFTTLVSARASNGQILTDITQSLALGGLTDGVTNMELCSAFATIANSGIHATPKLYTKVVDDDGNVILDNTMPTTRRVIKESTAYLLNSAMVDAVTSGTGAAANFSGMAVAGKTGTTSDNKDVWFAGYTPYYTCATWAGYDNNIHMNSTETNIAKKLWKAVMSRVHEELPNTPFDFSLENILQRTVCRSSGKLAVPGLCSNEVANYAYTEYFAEGTEPLDNCDIHYQGPVCPYSDYLPACPNCPFKQEGIRELPLIEDVSLHSGYPEGTLFNTVNECIHNDEFFMNPNYEAIIQQQVAELQARGIFPAEVPHEDEQLGE
jgi:penicillin-binding protein 1A